MDVPFRHFALGPLLWRSIDRAEETNFEERTAWQHGVASAAALVDNTRGAYGPLLSIALAVGGAFAVPVPWYGRLVIAAAIALLAYWLMPTIAAGIFAFRAPYAQRDAARQSVRQLRLKEVNELAAAEAVWGERVKAEREAFDGKWKETERIRGLLGQAENRIRELEAELEAKSRPRANLALAAGGGAGHEDLSQKIDAMVRRGFALYKELDVGPEPTETDEEGRGISFPIWPPESKWEPVHKFAHEANELLAEYDPGLLFAYADGVNAARRKLRRRERQREEAQQKLPVAEKLQATVECLHRRPAEDLECHVNALVDVKKELSGT